jgi:hypothetical protein
MDQIANNVLTVPIEKNMIFTIFLILINLPLHFVFQAPRLLGIFSTKLYMSISSKTGTCSLNIMLNNNFNFHTPWDP